MGGGGHPVDIYGKVESVNTASYRTTQPECSSAQCAFVCIMINAHLWIDDPGIPTENSQEMWLPPRIPGGWLCKRGEGTELNEIAGYQLAIAMQIPVPDHRFFVITSHDPREPFVDDAIAPWRVGLLIKEISGPRTNYSDLLQDDAGSGLHHLGLRLFSVSEWPELIQTKQGALAIDLEFIFAHLAVRSLDSAEEVDAAIKAYRDQTKHEFYHCYAEVRQFGLEQRFLEALKQRLELTNIQFSPNFSPLSKRHLIEEFYSLSFEARKAALLELVDLNW